MQDERQGSSFSLLHVDIQFSQQHLLKRLSSSSRVLGAFVEDQVAVAVWAYGCVFYCTSLVFMAVFCRYQAVFITALWYSLKSGIMMLQHWTFCSELLWLFKIFLCFHMYFRIGFSISVKNVVEFWDVDCFWQYGHLHNVDSADPRACQVFPSSDVFFDFSLSGL
jgi:hypothetical protein